MPKRGSGQLKGSLAEPMKAVLSAVAVALVGVLGFWLSPLKHIVQRQIYREEAEVSLSADRQSVSAAQPVQVRVRITQKSTLPLSKGVVRIQFDSSLLALSPESVQTVNMSEISGAITVEKPFELFAQEQASGRTQVFATFETSYGSYKSGPLTIELARHETGAGPFIEERGDRAINLSGQWHIELGGFRGNMAIVQDRQNNVTGSYALDDGARSRMRVDGYKDGTSFKVLFYRNDSGNQRYRIDANFALNPTDKRFVEIKGCAYAIEQDLSITEDSPPAALERCASRRNYVGWRGTGTSVFYATAQTRQQ